MDYTELNPQQVETTLRDSLRQHEHGHLQATLQLELAQAAENPDEHHVQVAERNVRDYEAQIKLLREKLAAAFPGE